MNLIDEYVNWAVKSCDAPKIFHEAAAYFIISSTIGRYVSIVTSYARTGIKPNVWVLFIGPSRIVRKTTACRMAKEIVEEVGDSYILPAFFSPEAFFEALASMNKGDVAVWFKDEMGGFFKSLNKSYMYGTRELLSSLFTGEGAIRKLRKETFEIPKGVYMTVLANAPTPPRSYLTEEDFSSGFMNRFLMAYQTVRDRTIPMLTPVGTLEKYRKELIKRIKYFTTEYKKQSPVIVSFDSESLEILERYDLTTEQEILALERLNPESLWKSYIAESPTYLLKLSVLRRIAREPLPDSSIVVVTKNDVLEASKFLAKMLKCAKEVIFDVESSPRSRDVITERKPLERVYTLIKEKGDTGMPWSQLLRVTGFLATDLARYIKTLYEQDRIIIIKAKSKRGRKPIILFASEYRARALQVGTEISADVLQVSER